MKMYCKKCKKEIEEGSLFCGACGQKISGNASVKMSKIGLIIVLAICLIVGGYILNVYMDEQENYRKEQEQIAIAKASLVKLGERCYGNPDARTVYYSMSLGFLRKALSPDMTTDDKSNKEYYFEYLEKYFDDGDYLRGFVLLMLGYDYLEKEDIDYFDSGENVNPYELQDEFKNALWKSSVDLGNFLISWEDSEICYNFSLKIRLAENGYVSVDDIYNELYDFVYKEKAFEMVDDDILEDSPDLIDIAENIEESFSGKKVYYKELTTSGKLVFLYLMPRYLCQVDDYGQEKGSYLWYCFEADFDEIWEKMIKDKKLVDVMIIE